MTIKPRAIQSPESVVNSLVDDLQKAGWSDLSTHWDENLKVWRAEGTYKGFKREGRGSNQEFALTALKTYG